MIGGHMAGEIYSIKIDATLSALKSYKERPFVKHQWEELVLHLYQMNDPLLIAMISLDMKFIRENDPSFKFH
jgi:hypothetical protein